MEGEDQKGFREAIRAIMESGMDGVEKTMAMQRLHSRRFAQATEEASASQPEEQIERTYFSEERGIIGCKHYQRGCKIRAPCCSKVFGCRLCHEEQVPTHSIERGKIAEMICMHCGEDQPIQKNCGKCGEIMGRYFCAVCKLLDNDPEKSIYHCDKCQMCRIGKGIDIDFFHCDRCNACMHVSLRQHKCVERSLESNCPICSVYMLSSTIPVTFLKCGHAMHTPCLDEYIKNSYTCPICSKSLGDMTSYFARIDEHISSQRMPEQFEGMRSFIMCNDCEKRSDVPFHFLYHKCSHCASYNTRVLSTAAASPAPPVTAPMET